MSAAARRRHIGRSASRRIAAAPLPIASAMNCAPSALAPGSAANSQPGRASRLSAVMPAISTSPHPGGTAISGPASIVQFHCASTGSSERFDRPGPHAGLILCSTWGVKRHLGVAMLNRHIGGGSTVRIRGAGLPDRRLPPAKPAACVRVADLSLAERARGLAASSVSPAVIGRWLAIRKLGANLGDSPGGRWREPCRSVSARRLRKRLTMPSSSEWKRDDGEPAARLQHALGGGEAVHQLAQLVVDVDAQRLEDARGRMPAGDLLPPQHALGQFSQLGRARERLLAAAGDDGAGDGAGAALVAQVEEDVGEVRIVLRVDDVGGGGSVACPCACRAGRRPGTRSRARGRRAASMRRRCRARRRRRAQSRRRLRCVPARRSVPSTSVRRPLGFADEALSGGDGGGIAVDGENARAGRRVQDGAGVAAGAEGAVNEGAVACGASAPALREAARECGAGSLCGRPRPRAVRSAPSFPCSSLAALPRETAPRAEQFAMVSDLFAGARAAGFEARGLPHLEFLSEAHEGDVGR